MPDRVRWQNNERVDIPDLDAATNGGSDTTDPGFAEAVQRQMLERFVLANFPAIADGFRVEIADQTTNPGEFTIHNGFGWTRAGAALEDESEIDAQISSVLPLASTSYFVEVELALAEASADARAFWDPTYDQGVDPSGDARAPGKEFSLQVATRYRPTWNLVSPISTTDFQINTNANSLRIPVARLETNIAGEIDNVLPSGTETARSALRANVSIGDVEVKLVNTRHMQDAFTLRVATWTGAAFVNEDLTVISNDRENNTLTIAPAAAADHLVGDTAVDITALAPQFVPPRAAPPLPTADSADARPRFWQGDEAAGLAVLRNPSDSTAQTDTEIANLKQYVDVVAATILDMKTGGALPPQTIAVQDGQGQNLVTTFNGLGMRWHERVGSIAGGKCATVTIGDGVNSYGDFNANAYTSFQACVAAALDAVKVGGFASARLYLKRTFAPYQVTGTTITIAGFTEGLTIIGDGNESEVQFQGAVAAFTVTGGIVAFENMKISRNGGSAAFAVEVTGNATQLSMRNCTVDSVGTSGAGNIASSSFDTCAFAITVSPGRAFVSKLVGVTFNNCSFSSTFSNAASTAITVLDQSLWVNFRRCTFSTNGAAINFMCIVNATSDIAFDQCTWIGLNAPAGGLYGVYGSLCTSTVLRLTDCTFTAAGTLYGFVNVSTIGKVYLSRCSAGYSANAGAVTAVVASSLVVKDCDFTQASSAGAKSGGGITWTDPAGPVLIDNVILSGVDYGIYGTATAAMSNVTVRRAVITPAAGASGKAGVSLTAGGALTKVLIDDCDISGFDDATVAVDGIVVSGNSSSAGVTVSNNRISSLGTNAVANVSGIRLVGAMRDACVRGNEIATIEATALGIGIYVNDDGVNSPQNVTVTDNKIRVVTTSGGPAYGISVPSFLRLGVRGNTITNITGNTNAAGVYTGGNLAAVANCTTLDISHNQISALEGTAGFARAVYVVRGAIGAVISHNQVGDLDAAGSGGDGIYVDTQSALGGGQVIKSLAITGNVMQRVTGADTFANGIAVVNLNNGGDGERLVTVTGNQVQQFTGNGILVQAGAALTTASVTISGNAVHSSVDVTAGIILERVTEFVIDGNSIALTLATQNQDGIYIDADCSNGVISGNQVYVNDPAALYFGLKLLGDACVVSGNKIKTGNIRCISIGAAATNNFIGPNATETGAPGSSGVSNAGGVTNVEQLSSAATNWTATLTEYTNYPY